MNDEYYVIKIKHINTLFGLIKDNKFDQFIEYLDSLDSTDIDINMRDEFGNYLIQFAVSKNNLDIVDKIIQKGGRIDILDTEGKSLLYYPIKYGYIAMLNKLLKTNEQNIGFSIVDAKDAYGAIPLHYAIKYGNYYAIAELLKLKADVNYKNNNLNALHLAIYKKDSQMVKLLIKHVKNINIRMKNSDTALHCACNFQLPDIVKVLLDNGADPNIYEYDNDFTPLFYAVLLNNFDIVRMLLDAGANLNIQDFDGNTVIHHAIRNRHNGILNLFFSRFPVRSKKLNIFENITSKYEGTTEMNKLGEVISDINKEITRRDGFINFNSDKKTRESVQSTQSGQSTQSTQSIQMSRVLSLGASGEILKNKAKEFNKLVEGGTKIKEGGNDILLNAESDSKISSEITDKSNDMSNVKLSDRSAMLSDAETNSDSNSEFDIGANEFPKAESSDKSNPQLINNSNNSKVSTNVENRNLVLETSLDQKVHIDPNIINIDGLTYMHYLLYEYQEQYLVYFEKSLLFSNLNLQDNQGNTILGLLCELNIWEKFIQTLEKKKLNIYIKNIRGIAPIDYVPLINYEKFINIVVRSYFNLLGRNIEWSKTWENQCSYVKNRTLNETQCFDLIREQIIKEKNSFPNKKNKININVQLYSASHYTTFIGDPLDILTGVNYLIKLYPNVACPYNLFTTKNYFNTEIDKNYSSQGNQLPVHAHVFNIEIIWMRFKIVYPNNFEENFTNIVKNGKYQIIIIPLGIDLNENAHSNYLYYHIPSHTLERFEPHGSGYPYRFNYNPEMLDVILEKKFRFLITSIYDQNPGFSYVTPLMYLPKNGFQMYDSIEVEQQASRKLGDPNGFCALWCIWYMEYRIKYHFLDPKKIVSKLLKDIRRNNISFRNLIRDYSMIIIKIRDATLSKFNSDINDIINGKTPLESCINIRNFLLDTEDRN